VGQRFQLRRARSLTRSIRPHDVLASGVCRFCGASLPRPFGGFKTAAGVVRRRSASVRSRLEAAPARATVRWVRSSDHPQWALAGCIESRRPVFCLSSSSRPRPQAGMHARGYGNTLPIRREPLRTLDPPTALRQWDATLSLALSVTLPQRSVGRHPPLRPITVALFGDARSTTLTLPARAHRQGQPPSPWRMHSCAAALFLSLGASSTRKIAAHAVICGTCHCPGPAAHAWRLHASATIVRRSTAHLWIPRGHVRAA